MADFLGLHDGVAVVDVVDERADAQRLRDSAAIVIATVGDHWSPK